MSFQLHNIKLERASDLTPEIHSCFLLSLRKSLHTLQLGQVQNPGVKQLRIRNWLFLSEKGEPIVDIVLDKGYPKASSVVQGFSASGADTTVSFDECCEVHRFFIDHDALFFVADGVSLRVGSPGPEPTLHDVEDFLAVVGGVVRFETWQPFADRLRHTMVLCSVCDSTSENPVVEFEVDGVRLSLPLASIKMAFALPRRAVAEGAFPLPDGIGKKRSRFRKL